VLVASHRRCAATRGSLGGDAVAHPVATRLWCGCDHDAESGNRFQHQTAWSDSIPVRVTRERGAFVDADATQHERRLAPERVDVEAEPDAHPRRARTFDQRLCQLEVVGPRHFEIATSPSTTRPSALVLHERGIIVLMPSRPCAAPTPPPKGLRRLDRDQALARSPSPTSHGHAHAQRVDDGKAGTAASARRGSVDHAGKEYAGSEAGQHHVRRRRRHSRAHRQARRAPTRTSSHHRLPYEPPREVPTSRPARARRRLRRTTHGSSTGAIEHGELPKRANCFAPPNLAPPPAATTMAQVSTPPVWQGGLILEAWRRAGVRRSGDNDVTCNITSAADELVATRSRRPWTRRRGADTRPVSLPSRVSEHATPSRRSLRVTEMRHA